MNLSSAEELRVGAARNVERVRDRLSFEFAFMAQQGLPVAVKEDSRGNTTFFSCRLTRGVPGSSPDPGQLFRHHLANALSDLIVNEWERAVIGDLIDQQCSSFNPAERNVLVSAASRNLDCRADGRPDLLKKVERKGRILRLIADYLVAHRDINIDGFITFRLRDYREQLGDAVGRAVDDFLMEKEYQEFVNLLRYFVEGQESKVKVIHVIILPHGSFKLMDERGAALSRDYLAESFLEPESEVNTEDLLVSALITAAPERIVIHCPADLDRMESLDTIRSVFEGKVTTCRGCHMCRGERRVSDASRHRVHQGGPRKKTPC